MELKKGMNYYVGIKNGYYSDYDRLYRQRRGEDPETQYIKKLKNKF